MNVKIKSITHEIKHNTTLKEVMDALEFMYPNGASFKFGLDNTLVVILDE